MTSVKCQIPQDLPKNHRHHYRDGFSCRPKQYKKGEQEFQNQIQSQATGYPNQQKPVCQLQGQTTYFPVDEPIWNGITRVEEDLCAQSVGELESQLPGCYYTNNFFRWCESQNQYANLMTEPMHFYKVYRNACRVDTDSVLRYADLTNKGEIYQLFSPVYKTVPYMGAGQRSLHNKDIEAQLQQGLTTTTYKSCEPTSGVFINRYQCLPDYGNPQRVEHTIEPWVRGGEYTRDYVRRVNYEKYCLNLQNNNIINRTQ